MLGGEQGARHLRNGNGARDYTLWVGNLQAKRQAWDIPVTLGLDVMHNSEDYARSDPDPFTAANREETEGFVISMLLGQLMNKGDWLGGYSYADIGTFAVNASFAQDDWMRWGSATQTDASDFTGHELRIGYVPAKNWNIVAILYVVEAKTSVQDGNRFRLDFNWQF